MPLSLEEVRKFLGRSATDPYGRILGRLVGVTTNVRDEMTAIEIETGKGDFEQIHARQVQVNGDSLVIIAWWKLEAEEFKREFDLVTRRNRALDELFSMGDIDKEVYQDLRKLHEDSIASLKERRRTLLDSLNTRISSLTGQARELQTHLANNKMLHASGEVEDGAYKSAVDLIESGLLRSTAERRDIEGISAFLKRLESSPVQSQEPTVEHHVESRQPEVVMVHLKEE